VPAAGDGEAPPFVHGILYRRYYLLGGADDPDVVRARPKPLVELLVDYSEISRIVGTDFDGFDLRILRVRCRMEKTQRYSPK
jgi:hypothetical protein